MSKFYEVLIIICKIIFKQKDGCLLGSYFYAWWPVFLLIRVTVTGIYRATPMRVNPRQRNVKAVYKTYIDVIHFKKTDKKRLYSKDPDG